MNTDPDSSRVIEAASRSDVGRVRAHNEDLLFIDPGHRWAVLADGMGGYSGGAIAARIGVEVTCKALDRDYRKGWEANEASRVATAAVEEANREVYRAGDRDPELSNMGSTLLVVCPVRGGVVSVHVGDSRLYRFRCGVLQRLTRDHTLLQEYIDEGVFSEEEVMQSGARGVLTRALGVYETVEVEVGVHDIEPGDVLLLCSDGLTDMLHEPDIAELLSAASLEDAAEALVLAANLRGGRDNISVTLMRMG